MVNLNFIRRQPKTPEEMIRRAATPEEWAEIENETKLPVRKLLKDYLETSPEKTESIGFDRASFEAWKAKSPHERRASLMQALEEMQAGI